MSNKGYVWPPEWRTLTDPVSGATIHQLTDYFCHSYHPYFTEPGWYDGGRRLVFSSERGNAQNLFSIDLETGEILQLTDLDPADGDLGTKVAVSAIRHEVIYYQGGKLMALDLHTLNERALYERPEGYVRGATNVTADGRYVLTYHVQDLSDMVDDPGYRDYMIGRKGGSSGGFQKMVWEKHPHCVIVRVATDGSGSEVIYEEEYYLGHVNPSPTLPNILTFCHEGPWNLVENRIRGLDAETGEVWQIRPNAPDEAIGHEYWMQDGEHIGYHGRTLGGPVYGSIRYDNTDQVEAPFDYGSTHFHSLDLDLIIGDGSRQDPYLLLWQFRAGEFVGPKVLAWHRGSMHVGHIHVHPTMSPDGRQVLYGADPQGYCQVYLADIPEFDRLPDRREVSAP